MNRKEIKQWLINDGQVPEGCDNNEYWNHWYDVINRMMQEQGQTLPLDNVSDCAFLVKFEGIGTITVIAKDKDEVKAKLKREGFTKDFEILTAMSFVS